MWFCLVLYYGYCNRFICWNELENILVNINIMRVLRCSFVASLCVLKDIQNGRNLSYLKVYTKHKLHRVINFGHFFI